MKASSISASTQSINMLKLLIALVLSGPAAHAQTPASTAERKGVDTSQATGAAIDSTGTSNHAPVSTSNSTVVTNAGGATEARGTFAQVGRPKSTTPSEPTPWHPLTDF